MIAWALIFLLCALWGAFSVKYQIVHSGFKPLRALWCFFFNMTLAPASMVLAIIVFDAARRMDTDIMPGWYQRVMQGERVYVYGTVFHALTGERMVMYVNAKNHGIVRPEAHFFAPVVPRLNIYRYNRLDEKEPRPFHKKPLDVDQPLCYPDTSQRDE